MADDFMTNLRLTGPLGAAAAEKIERLRKALQICLDAIETGRSEPLYIARDHARNTLEDLFEKRDGA